MADSKKYNGSTWEHSLRKLATATDTFTTLPVDVYADGNNATVSLKGNTVQNGTPTPDNPIQPSECGERTGNLFDYKTVYSAYLQPNGDVTASAAYFNNTIHNSLADFIGKQITISVNCVEINSSRVQLRATINGSSVTGENKYQGDTGIMSLTVTPQSANDWWSITYGTGDTDTYNQFMVSESSSYVPYEPFGVKIPILSAGQTTPIYLGEVETTRKIKKLVLTGEEDWVQSVSGVKVYRINVSDYLREIDNIPICTHYKGIATVAGTGNLQDLETALLLSSSGNNYCYIRDDRFNNANDFKSYLATQYAAGTPVTVWYVLATPTTGIVNEPIRKIGAYADTVSGITIPTIAGANSFDVLTTLKPSEVTVNYKGWHPVSAVHERENGAWT